MTQPHLTYKDLMRRYQVSSSTIFNWLKQGRLPQGIRIARTRRWDIGELEVFEKRVSSTQKGDI